jgi:hypothetical protein
METKENHENFSQYSKRYFKIRTAYLLELECKRVIAIETCAVPDSSQVPAGYKDAVGGTYVPTRSLH